jgi:hypothetical protein
MLILKKKMLEMCRRTNATKTEMHVCAGMKCRSAFWLYIECTKGGVLVCHLEVDTHASGLHRAGLPCNAPKRKKHEHSSRHGYKFDAITGSHGIQPRAHFVHQKDGLQERKDGFPGCRLLAEEHKIPCEGAFKTCASGQKGSK